MNAYEPPNAIKISNRAAISSNIIERLIEGKETEDLAFYDVSDRQLYGRKNRQRLTGDVARRATESGCDTVVFQSVLWWCFVYVPVVPLGVYAVMPKLECDAPDGDAIQYRGIRISWDWRQIGVHYAILAVCMALIGAIAWRWLSSA